MSWFVDALKQWQKTCGSLEWQLSCLYMGLALYAHLGQFLAVALICARYRGPTGFMTVQRCYNVNEATVLCLL